MTQYGNTANFVVFLSRATRNDAEIHGATFDHPDPGALSSSKMTSILPAYAIRMLLSEL
jgi:hypothetical protein